MRRGLVILTVTCAMAIPATAAAQCGPPKGVYIANTELANATYLFSGQTLDGLSAVLSAPDSAARQAALQDLVGAGTGNAVVYASVVAQYPLKALRAQLTEPPECGRRAPAQRKRRASAGRRR